MWEEIPPPMRALLGRLGTDRTGQTNWVPAVNRPECLPEGGHARPLMHGAGVHIGQLRDEGP